MQVCVFVYFMPISGMWVGSILANVPLLRAKLAMHLRVIEPTPERLMD